MYGDKITKRLFDLEKILRYDRIIELRKFKGVEDFLLDIICAVKVVGWLTSLLPCQSLWVLCVMGDSEDKYWANYELLWRLIRSYFLYETMNITSYLVMANLGLYTGNKVDEFANLRYEMSFDKVRSNFGITS